MHFSDGIRAMLNIRLLELFILINKILYLLMSVADLPFSFQAVLRDDGTIIFIYKDVSPYFFYQ